MIHITLTTGHTRESPRSEVGDQVLPVVQDLLYRALVGERVPVPGVPQLCTMRASAADSALLITVYTEGGQSVPIVTFGIACHERDSRPLWEMLHDSAAHTPIKTNREKPPSAPWCAARIEVGSAIHQQPMDWVGDFERCIAWGWMEMQEERS